MEWKKKINTMEGTTNSIHNQHDDEYAKLLKYVLENGKERYDRTGTGTISTFAPPSMRFDIANSVPLLTTKRMAWKGIIKELLWFLRGDTDARILQKDGVRIWDGNSSKEFLKKRGLPYTEGVLGPVYGWQFRRFGATYDEKFSDGKNITQEQCKELGGFDQLKYVENLLKTDPFSRRIYINLWNANDLDKMALPPCHLGINLYVEEDDEMQKWLSGHIYIRSNDMFLGNPFNIFSYTVFIYILSKRCDMKPKNLVISLGDAHIYKDHIEQVKQQLERTSYSAPRLIVSDRVEKVEYEDISISDFLVENYISHPSIKANMSA